MIRKLLQSALCLGLAPLLVAQQVTSSIAAAPEASKPTSLMKGEEVRLVLLEPVSSASAVKGQLVRMAVLKDVTDENGVVVIPKGTPAKDMVDGVIKAVPGKKDGRLSLRPVSVNPPNSAPIALRNFEYGESDGLGVAFAPLLPFCLIAMFVAMPFHKRHKTGIRHEEGIDANLQACGWQTSQVRKTIRLQPSAIDRARSASSDIDPGSVCPYGATYELP
jgi:hypothetical protein